jgi:hypothetical protein
MCSKRCLVKSVSEVRDARGRGHHQLQENTIEMEREQSGSQQNRQTKMAAFCNRETATLQ